MHKKLIAFRLEYFAPALAAFFLLAAEPARAAVPPQFSVQGVLRDDMGKLQSMPLEVTVTLYDAQNAGNKIAGPYGPTMVAVTNGLFSVNVGDNALTTELSQSSSAVWLEIVAGTTMFPRQQVTSQLYAVLAASAAAADSLSSNCALCVTDAMIKNLDASKLTGKVSAAASADMVTNGVVSTGSYADPSWLTSLAGAKITGKVATAAAADNATTVTNGLYSTGNYSDPAWLASLSGAKITGKVAAAASADSVTNGLYATGNYADPAWLTALSGAKIMGKVAAAMNADTVTSGLYSTGTYADPAWLTALSGAKVMGQVTDSANLGGVAAVNYQQILKGGCAAGMHITAIAPDGTVTCGSSTVVNGFSAAALSPDNTGALGHITFTAPADGSATVTATYDVNADNNSMDCTISTQVATAAAQPASGSGYEAVNYPATVNSKSMNGVLLTKHGSITTIVAVNSGANSIYLNGAMSMNCASANWNNVSITAKFVPTVVPVALTVP